MSVRVAPAVKAMFTQANALAPKRSKASDGTRGDKAHSKRKSEHNPGPVEADGHRYVYAGDLTDDPAGGFDSDDHVRQALARRDRRIDYVISDGEIIRSYDRPATVSRPFLPAWKPERYTGPNPHTKHAHVSVLPAHRDDTSPWWLIPADPEEEPIVFTARHSNGKVYLFGTGRPLHLNQAESKAATAAGIPRKSLPDSLIDKAVKA